VGLFPKKALEDIILPTAIREVFLVSTYLEGDFQWLLPERKNFPRNQSKTFSQIRHWWCMTGIQEVEVRGSKV
jgi:hypothetical protein